jgi:hypothetical protein
MFPNTEIDYQKLAGALLAERAGGDAVTFKHTSPGSTPTYGSYAHGPGGLFSFPGMSRPVFSAMVLPQAGLLSRLPVYASNEVSPLFALVTGVTAESGSEPEGPCDDGPTPGLLKLCTTSLVFGRVARNTPVFELDRFGLTTNRGEFYDYQLMGQPFQGGAMPNVPSVPEASLGNSLRSDIAKAMFEFAVAWARSTATDVYEATPPTTPLAAGASIFGA